MVASPDEMVLVGIITRTHGVRGEVRVRVESDYPERFTPPARFHTNLPDLPLLILRGARWVADGVVAQFAGVTSLESASRLVGVDLLIFEAHRRQLETGEYWPDQLIGLEVRIGEADMGVVTGMILGPQDRMVVALRDGTVGEVPFVAPLVPEVDPEGGWVRIEPPDGLFNPPSTGRGRRSAS